MMKKNKYHAQKVTYKGQTFDSKREAGRYAQLLLMERAGLITDLVRQIPYILIPAQFENGKCIERACTYYADFVYRENGKLVVEDTKGVRTPDYIIKRKLMLLVYGIRVREV